MIRFSSNRIFVRFAHREDTLPKLDFTKPTSDRIKRKALNNQDITADHNEHEALLKVSLRGQCLFGLHPVELALKTQRRQFYKLMLSRTSHHDRPLLKSIELLAKKLSVPIKYTTTSVLDHLAFDRPHQGVCLDCSALPLPDIKDHDTEELNQQNVSIDLCLVKIHDPMNLGAIIRTAHFFGIQRVILTNGSCCPSPVASKASSGALELMSIFKCDKIQDYLQILRDRGTVGLVCGSDRADQSLRNVTIQNIAQKLPSSLLKRIVILIGNEHQGIDQELTSMCHCNVSIQGDDQRQVSSLNASVASALFLYHFDRQLHEILEK